MKNHDSSIANGELNTALKSYAIDLISEKLAELSKIDKIFTDRYNLDFVTFADKIKNDKNYTIQLEKKNEFIEWDEDFISWEFNSNEINYWKEKLQNILL